MIDWLDKHIKVAVLQLLLSGKISKGVRNQKVVEYLLSLGWLKHAPARSILELSPSAHEKLQTIADQHWPELKQCLRFFRNTGCNVNLRNLQRAEKNKYRIIPSLPRYIHWKTYAAIKGEHSKQKEFKNALVGGSVSTSDEALRFRPNRGLILQKGNGTQIECDMLSAVTEEGMLTERALLRGFTVAGEMPKKIMTIENLGAFVDFPIKNDLLLVFQPGWNTDLSIQFLSLFPENIPWLHFGDLDPEGLAIYNHLLQRSPSRPIIHFIPEFWEEYFHEYAHGGCNWSAHASFPHPLLCKLSATGQWLEQEAIVLDKRILETL